MTDDFQLFANPDDGGRAIDPDLALISAYLARELSPMQVLAVEERLATDAAFRAAMQPLIDAWAAPVAAFSGGAATRVAALSTREKTDGWQRFQRDQLTTDDVIHTDTRRISMKRVAAMIGLTVLPVFSFAQAVTYASRHEDAPGHEVATRIVAAFTAQPRVAPPVVETVKPTPRAEDIPLGQALPAPAPVPVKKAQAAAELLPVNPDRARIASLVKQHQARVASGDTVVEYVVMVVDAAGKYLWSSIGSGNLQIEVAGDTRTPAERRAYNQEFRQELFGASGGAGARGGGGALLTVDSGRLRAMTDSMRVLLPSTGGVRARGGGGSGGVSAGASAGGGGRMGRARGMSGDTMVLDSALLAKMSQAVVSARAPYAIARTDSGSVRAIQIPDSTAPSRNQPGTYRTGWVFTMNGMSLNQASGLQEPGNGESGIQGIRSASVAATDMYLFPAGEVSPKPLRVVVARLVAGTSWRRRF